MSDLAKWLSFRPWERHSLVLLVGGLVYIGVGLIFMTTTELTPSREATLALALSHAPLPTWGFIFVAGGVLVCSSSRWPSFHNTWGYMILTGVASGWSGMYLIGYIFVFTHHGTLAYAMIWGLLAFLWWAISGLVNPEQIVEVVDVDPHRHS